VRKSAVIVLRGRRGKVSLALGAAVRVAVGWTTSFEVPYHTRPAESVKSPPAHCLHSTCTVCIGLISVHPIWKLHRWLQRPGFGHRRVTLSTLSCLKRLVPCAHEAARAPHGTHAFTAKVHLHCDKRRQRLCKYSAAQQRQSDSRVLHQKPVCLPMHFSQASTLPSACECS
jgi:hypothetical protein